MNRYRCTGCDVISDENTLLTALNPFDATETITGCPICKSVDASVMTCDEPGCSKDVSCGWPSPAGYRHTCGTHWDYKK